MANWRRCAPRVLVSALVLALPLVSGSGAGARTSLSIPAEELGALVTAPNEPQLPLKAVDPRAEGLELRSVAAPGQVIQYGRFEAVLDLSATYDNPFDPGDIDVSAEFSGPGGRTWTVPGYFDRPYERRLEGDAEQLTRLEGDTFRIRFCPPETGTYRFRVRVRDRSGTVESAERTLECTPSDSEGFVRRAKDPLYFAFDSGRGYFALGMNVCWPGPKGTFDYDRWFTKMADAGCNYARLWLGPFDLFALERAPEGNGALGAGRHDLTSTWALDYVLSLAEERGIYLMLCIDSFNSLRASDPYPYWSGCPYNLANGGPCARPEEFFINDRARELFRWRLRHLVARYAHSTHVLSWEFWNEVDIIERYVPDEVKAWHQEMARYLREIDPYDHLITTSFANSNGDPEIDALPEMDYVQTHNYGSLDTAEGLLGYTRRKIERFGKPHIVGEFGTGAMAEGNGADTDGIHLHDGIWSTSLAQSAGCAQLWWWDNYVEPRDLYYHFAALSRFLEDVDFANEGLVPIEIGAMRYRAGAPAEEPTSLALTGASPSWGPDPANEPRTHTVARDGTVTDADTVPGIIHGTANHPDLHNPVTFMVDYPRDGRFIVHVRGTSGHGGARLVIRLDGEEVLVKELPDKGDPERFGTVDDHNGPYPIDVPAGEHEIVVDNTGRDWFYVEYEFTDYAVPTAPRLHAVGLHNDRRALVWIRNRLHTWYQKLRQRPWGTVAPSEIELRGLADGAYRIEWWDAYAGKPVREERATCEGGSLWLGVDALETDCAARLWRE